ncbi:MAG: glycogen/starch/alpha-glucan family phosphorylase, partial [Myxococcales bacterium]|nr:glycogen/starch/alpha-glucan family phosphorylase [Myxococcales bacterium]
MDQQRFRTAVTRESVTPGLDAASLRHDFVEKLYLELAKFPGVATKNDQYLALSYVVRDRLLERWVRSASTYLEKQSKTVIYLSAEFLPGPQLANAVLNLGLDQEVRAACEQLGLDYDELTEHEEEPGLGNGGLGRLAACFMDSLATLELPAIGHGIRYEYGIFDQEIRGGQQVERTDRWLHRGNPWEVRRYEIEYTVGFGGYTQAGTDELGHYRVKWVPERVVIGAPWDTCVPGYGTSNTNFLRLWSARAHDEFDLGAFNQGDYWRAVDAKVKSENISKVLYPNDSSLAGKTLRLEQQYFFVSCALQDCLRFLLQRTTIDKFADKFAVQLNDTHPALAVAELMRLFMDVHHLPWDQAWDLTRRACGYTNHTLLPEALETWPLPLFQALLPRHTEIIFELNRRFLEELRGRFPGDDDRARRMSLLDEGGDKSVRMAHLATVGSHRVNGVAALHSRLLKETVLKDFAELWPDKFTNVTNGVTPRRFLALANPKLTKLLTEALGGDGWLRDLTQLKGLERFAKDAAFREKWRKVKHVNKQAFASWISEKHGLVADPDALCDVQVKRIHEYKRQHLAALYVADTFLRIKDGDTKGLAPRSYIFSGKAAPAYHMAKLIIRFINALSESAAHDPAVRKWLHVVFAPDFNVKNAQHIYPAADLSEQISTAGKEASGTGNMKMSMNGALTIGTLDGANVEI